FPCGFAAFLRAKNCTPRVRLHVASARATTPRITPCPNFPLRESRCKSFLILFLGKRKFWLCAFEQSLQISAVLENDEDGRSQSAAGDRQRRSMSRGPKKVNQERHGRCGRNGAQ